jgi:protein required for attachment to host cells
MGQIVGGPAGRLHVISARTPLHDVIAAQFARGLVDDLVEAHDDGRFQQLDIVAPPRFLGLIRQTLPLSLASHVGLELDKDWVHLPASDVARRYEAVKLHR